MRKNVFKTLCENYMVGIEDIFRYVKNPNTSKSTDQWVTFYPYANFNHQCPKVGPCDLFPVLFKCVTCECTTVPFIILRQSCYAGSMLEVPKNYESDCKYAAK